MKLCIPSNAKYIEHKSLPREMYRLLCNDALNTAAFICGRARTEKHTVHTYSRSLLTTQIKHVIIKHTLQTLPMHHRKTESTAVGKRNANKSFEVGAGECWIYIKTVVNIVREPVLVLDKDFRIMTANEPFYRMFQVDPRQAEGTVIFTLGDGQWNMPELRKLLEQILPQNTFFNGFEIKHNFPFIGHKAMVLNARQIKPAEQDGMSLMTFLAIEDVTPLMAIAETLTAHIKDIAMRRVQSAEPYVEKLEKELGLHKEWPYSV